MFDGKTDRTGSRLCMNDFPAAFFETAHIRSEVLVCFKTSLFYNIFGNR